MTMVHYENQHGGRSSSGCGSPGFLETILEEEDVFEDAVSELESLYSDAESVLGNYCWRGFK